MSTRSIMYQEFPRGWWRSRSWWLAGAAELALGIVAALAAVVLFPDVRRVLRHRRSPWRLSRQRVPVEGWMAGMSVGLIVVGGVVLGLLSPDGPAMGNAGSVVVLLWFLLNVTVSVTVLWVLLGSRLQQHSTWEDLDFIERHLPRYGSPPSTTEAYRAMRLLSEFESAG